MDDENKIKKLQMKIENLLIEKDIQKRSDALLRLENNKKQEKMINDILKSKTDDRIRLKKYILPSVSIGRSW